MPVVLLLQGPISMEWLHVGKHDLETTHTGLPLLADANVSWLKNAIDWKEFPPIGTRRPYRPFCRRRDAANPSDRQPQAQPWHWFPQEWVAVGIGLNKSITLPRIPLGWALNIAVSWMLSSSCTISSGVNCIRHGNKWTMLGSKYIFGTGGMLCTCRLGWNSTAHHRVR